MSATRTKPATTARQCTSIESGVFCDESDGDDLKLLGFYSTLERVEERVRQARLLPGFRDEPDCFYFDACELDEDDWTEGFVRVPPGE
jgi:hypothetical protein